VPFSKNRIRFEAINLSNGYVRLRISGRFQAKNSDRRILVRINGKTADYQTWCSGGEPNIPINEPDPSGIYVGRNAYHQDAVFVTELFISTHIEAGKILGLGQSTFSLSNGFIGNERCTSSFSTFDYLDSLEILVSPDTEIEGSATIEVERP